MSIDYQAIIEGLADRFAPANITPPTGLKNVVASHAYPPNELSNFPVVVAFSGDSELTTGGGQRSGEHEYFVRFILGASSGNYAQDYSALEAWKQVLADQFFGSIATNSKLGLGGLVDKALVTQIRIVTFEYGGVEYLTIELTVTVWTSDTVSYTRP